MQAIRAARKSGPGIEPEELESAAIATTPATSETLQRSDPPPPAITTEVPIGSYPGSDRFESDRFDSDRFDSDRFESDSFGLPTPRVTPALRDVLVHAEGEESASILALSDTAPRPIVRLEPESTETPVAVSGHDERFDVASSVRQRMEAPAPAAATPTRPRMAVVVAVAVVLAGIVVAGYWALGRA